MKTVHFYILLTLNRIHSSTILIHNSETNPFTNDRQFVNDSVWRDSEIPRPTDSYLHGFSLIIVQPRGLQQPTEGEREGEGKNDTKQSHPVASFSVAASFIAPDKCVSTGRFVAASFVPAFAQPQAVASERIRKSRWNRNQDGEGAAHRDSLSSYFWRISTGDLVNGDEDRSDSKNGGENRGGWWGIERIVLVPRLDLDGNPREFEAIDGIARKLDISDLW